MIRRFIAGTLVVLAIAGGGLAIEFIVTRNTTPVLTGVNAIASLETIELGGVGQSVLIRGHDTDKPIILFLHGGPGMPVMFFSHAVQSELEQDFIVVHWDRRGAGKSFAAAPEGQGLTVSQTIEDTLELTQKLLQRFGQQRLYLAGHSWGTYLGLLAVREKPEYYQAFIGMGQMAGTQDEINAARRTFLTGLAQSSRDSALMAKLENGNYRITEDDLFLYGGELYGADSFLPILKTGLAAPEYTLFDVLNVKQGAHLVGKHMVYDVSPKPHMGEIQQFSVPIVFFLGRHDYNTPSALAAEYLNRLTAPMKQLVWFEQSAHFPFYEQPQLFHQEMRKLHQNLMPDQASD